MRCYRRVRAFMFVFERNGDAVTSNVEEANSIRGAVLSATNLWKIAKHYTDTSRS